MSYIVEKQPRSKHARRCSRFGKWVESMEPRTLLSAPALDTTFGAGGYLGNYRAVAVRDDGYIVAQPATPSNQTVPPPLELLAPDGSAVGPYVGVAPQASPPFTSVQPDGKYFSLTVNGLVRYNADGSVDTAFAAVTLKGNPGPANVKVAFQPDHLVVHGDRVYMTGLALDYDAKGFTIAMHPGAEAWTIKGAVDQSFGQNGLAIGRNEGNVYFNSSDFSLVGPDGELYIAQDIYEQPQIQRFTSGGQPDGNFIANGSFGRGTVYGIAFQADGKIVILQTDGNNNTLTLFRTTRDLKLDPTFGRNGSFVPVPLATMGVIGDVYAAAILQRGDGDIIVSALSSAVDAFTFVYAPAPIARTGSVSGRLFNDINGNHKQDPGEPDLAYWQAYADLNNNGIFDTGEPTAYTNGGGQYTITNVPAGSYHIREVRQTGWTRTTPAGDWPVGGVYNVVVAVNKTVSNINFGNSIPNHATGTLSGTLFRDTNGDQVQDEGETPLAGWQVYADVNNNGIYDTGEPIATAGANGHYTLSDLSAGGYRLREIRHQGWIRTNPGGDYPLGYYDVSLAPGQSRGGYTFGNVVGGNFSGGYIAGYIFGDLNGNGKLDPGEKPLAGLQVSMIMYDTGDTTTTDANGYYSFGPFPTAYYQYYLRLEDGRNRFIGDSVHQVLLSSGQTALENYFAQPLGGFDGYVYNDANNNGKIDAGEFPVDGDETVYVDLNNNGKLDANEPQANSNEGYGYRLFGLGEGSYILRVIPPTGWVQTKPSSNLALHITLGPGQILQNEDFAVHKIT